VLRVATDPDGFFRDLEPGLVGPAAVVVLVGVPALGVGLVEAFAAGTTVRAVVRRVVSRAAGAVGLWVGVAGLLQFTTWVVGGSGSYWDTLRYVGYGFLPAVLSSALELLTVLVVAVTGGSPVDHPLVGTLDGPAVTLVFFAWTGLLWTFGLREARDLSMQAALTAVALGVVVAVGLAVVASALGGGLA